MSPKNNCRKRERFTNLAICKKLYGSCIEYGGYTATINAILSKFANILLKRNITQTVTRCSPLSLQEH